MRRAARNDNNQHIIVRELRRIPSVTVATRHDDILVGFRGRTFWYEIKNPDKIKQDGELKAGAIRPSQTKLLDEWTGHYKVVTTIKEILIDIGAITE